MLKSNEFAYMDAAKLSRMLHSKELSPVEVIEASIARIEVRNPSINAFVLTDFENARRLAKISEKRLLRGEGGVMEGIPTAMKDLFDFYPTWPNTMGGIRCLKNRASANFNVYMERMVRAGAIPLGKTNSPTLGFRGTCDNFLFGPTRNPFNLAKNSGGSSGGAAAAVADGMVPLAEGTDGGGSIRIPAAWCNLFGYKAALGTVPFICRPNAFGAINPFFFEMALTRTVEDAAMTLNVIAGYHHADPFSMDVKCNFLDCLNGGIKGARIAYTSDFGIFPLEYEVKKRVEESVLVFQTLGATVEEVDFGIRRTHQEMSDVWCRLIVMSALDAVEGLRKEGIDLINEHRNDLPPELIHWIEVGYQTTLKEYLFDQELRTEIFDAFQNIFAQYDFIVSPTLCCKPVDNNDDGNTLGPSIINGDSIDPLIGWCMTYFTNFTGHPSASVPAGLTSDGLPVGMQVIGRRFDDIGLLRACHEFECAQPWAGFYKIPDSRM
jgi:amidase